MKIRQRALALLLSLAMVLAFMPAAFAGSENEGATRSITTSYTVRESSPEDRFTWMVGESRFYPESGDKLQIGDKEYTFIIDEDIVGFISDEEVISQEDFSFIYKQGDKTFSEEDDLTAGTYDLYITFSDPNYESAYVCQITVTENIYEKIEYIPAKTTYTISELDKYKWPDSDAEWTAYYIPVQAGDKLGVKIKGEDIKYYTAAYNEDEYVFDLDESDEGETLFFSSLWYGDNKPITGSPAGTVYDFSLELYGRTAYIPITVIDTSQQDAAAAAAAQEAALNAAFNGIPDAAVPAAKSVKAKAAKKAFTVNWKKANKKALKKFDKVEIQWSQDPSFPRTATSVKEVKKTKKSFKVKKLAKKSVYYVRVRDIKYVSGSKHVSGWSKAKKVKIK